MMKNIQQYLFMSFQTGVFRMTMVKRAKLIDFDIVSPMYKINNGIASEKTQTFDKCESIHSYNTRVVTSGNFFIPKMKTSKGQA